MVGGLGFLSVSLPIFGDIDVAVESLLTAEHDVSPVAGAVLCVVCLNVNVIVIVVFSLRLRSWKG